MNAAPITILSEEADMLRGKALKLEGKIAFKQKKM
jgi:hypothetical protein